MKSVISLLLILTLGFQSLVKIGLVTFYQLKKEYIIRELCENNDKPQLHCNGKCFLKKSLATAEKAEKEAAEFVKQVDSPLLVTRFSSHTVIQYFTLRTVYTDVLNFYSHNSLSSIFHPPLFRGFLSAF